MGAEPVAARRRYDADADDGVTRSADTHGLTGGCPGGAPFPRSYFGRRPEPRHTQPVTIGADAARGGWRSRPAVFGYAVLVGTLIGAGVWSARAGSGDEPSDASPSPTAQASPSAGPGTPKITIELTPSWESAADPAARGLAALHVQPASAVGAVPLVLAGPGGADGAAVFSRLNPADGRWLWQHATGPLTQVASAGTTTVISGSLDRADGAPLPPSAGPLVVGLDPLGEQIFSSKAGEVVRATPTRVVMQNGRRLVAVTPGGQRVWRSLLPTGVTDVAQASDDAAPLVFQSETGPARVSVVNGATGSVTTHRLSEADPEAWSTPRGVLVTEPSLPATITLYDRQWQPVWTVTGPLVLQDVKAGSVLVVDTQDSQLQLLDLTDGTITWASDPQNVSGLRGELTVTQDNVALVTAFRTESPGDDAESSVLAVDAATGEELWEAGSSQLVGAWESYVLLTSTQRAVLTAVGVRDGTSFATLNTSTVVVPETSGLVGDELIYLDRDAGMARGVELTSGS